MAHIDVGTQSYLLMAGDARPDASGVCTCWDRQPRGRYGEIYFADETSVSAGRVVAEVVLRAINDAVRQGVLRPEAS